MNRFPRRLALLSATALLTIAASCSSDDSPTDASTDASTDATSVSVSSTVEPGSESESVESTDATAPTTAAGGDSDTITDRADIVDFLLTSAIESGLDIDNQCVLDVVAQLSDDDAALLADGARAGALDGTELSPDGQALGTTLLECATATTAVVGG